MPFFIWAAMFWHTYSYKPPVYYAPPVIVQSAPMQAYGPGLIDTRCVTRPAGKGTTITVCP